LEGHAGTFRHFQIVKADFSHMLNKT
jgi:hypothetical protein